MFLKFKRAFNINNTSHPSVNVDLLMEENLQLMKEIRAKRIKFYKFNRIANNYLSPNS